MSKDVVRKNVRPYDFIEIVGDHFILTNVENTGAIMGFGANLAPIFKLIFLQFLPVMVLAILLFRILQRSQHDKWLILALTFVIGGGMGNLIDRIAYGSVTDFFQLQWGFLKTGIFNLADVSVTLGVLLILLVSLRHKKIAR
ncbi:MAG: signal peptidase II [Maribacter sp.]|nr:signal peptidase II [Maribacter sp.]